MPKPAKNKEKNPVRGIRFTKQGEFRKVLNERVNTYLSANHLPARDVPAMYLKTAIILVWWLAAYLLLLLGHFPLWANLILCVLWALAIAAVGFNIMHDSNHGGYSENPRTNKLISLSAEMLGMSGFRWRTKHNVWHHTYTNVHGFDDDVETYGTMRLTPRAPWRPLFRGQLVYFPLVYSMIAFDFIVRDFLMVLIGKSDENHIYPKMGAGDQAIFWAGKAFFFLIMFALPLQVFAWWQVLIGFTFVMMVVGLVMGIVFQLAHINADAAFPVPVGTPPHINGDWAAYQVETTTDFAPGNRLLCWYVGGLNFQIEHHLLPHICHINYPRLAPIVQATCKEFGIPYHCYPTWRKAFVAHLGEVRLLSQPNAPARG